VRSITAEFLTEKSVYFLYKLAAGCQRTAGQQYSRAKIQISLSGKTRKIGCVHDFMLRFWSQAANQLFTFVPQFPKPDSINKEWS